MCGRFTLTVDAHQIREAFPWISVPENVQPRYNIAPSQPIAVVPNDRNNELDYFVWGLIPSWAKDPNIGNRMINARGETVEEKPSFRAAFRRRRCLILADGFYEWKKEEEQKAKTPFPGNP
jgi:putative SOS response-associated peptidase YedK